MEILFGWELDGAAWLRGGKPGVVGQVTAGPGSMASILGTRLGVTAPEIPRPLRVAAYRRALEATAHPWCARSLSLDGWATASQLLSLRDQLVELGWEPSGSVSSPRLAALASAEVVFVEDPEHAGTADLLRASVRELKRRVAAADPAPVGINSVTVMDRGALPAPWTEIFSALAGLDVEVRDAVAPEAVSSVRIVSAATEWQAAETAARILATDPSLTLLSTTRSDALDQELARRGLPRIGRSDSSDQRAASQIVPLFLDAVTRPVDVHAFAALLDLGLSATEDADGEVHAVRLVPSAVRHRLLGALTREPGIGGSAWGTALSDLAAAVPEALEEFGADDSRYRQAVNAAAIATDLHRLTTEDALLFTDGTCATADIVSALGWLETRLRKLGRATDATALTAASASVGSVIAVLRERESVSRPELHRIIVDCCPPAPSPLSGAEASTRSVCTSPGHLTATERGKKVLWWGAIDDSAPLSRRWTPAEVRELGAAGVSVPRPTDLAALSVTAQLRGLRHAGDVVAVVMRSLDGAPTALHPLLDFAVQDTDPTGGSVPDLIKRATVDASDLIDSGTWRFGEAALEVTNPVRELIQPVDPTVRKVRPGTHLLPQRLSYSQMEKLLIHRLEWLLYYPLEIRPGQLASLPSGNQLIGTFEHAIVEEIVHRRVPDPGAPDIIEVSETEVAEVFDELLPHLASELLLPGQSKRREQLRREALGSIPAMFAELAAAGIRVRAVEKDFEVPLTLTLRDPDPGHPDGPRPDITHTLTINGFRDLDAVGNEGFPVVVDLKYSGSKTKYRDLVQSGRSLQLALYAWSVADGENLPLSAVTTAYYELKYGRFNSADPRLGGLSTSGHATEDLWEVAKRSVAEALAEIAFNGDVRDVGNELKVRVAEQNLSYSQARKAAENVAAVVHDRGGFLPTENFTYVDYGVLTGIEGDQS